MLRLRGVLAAVLLGVLGVFGWGEVVLADTGYEACDSLSPTQREAVGCDAEATATSSVVGILNLAIGLIGVVAVIVMIIGGITFATSQGDAGKTAKGRMTLIYGAIGLIVAILAFAIVSFVSGAIS